MKRWILVADAADAKIYSLARGEQTLRLEREMNHPASREKTQELVSDKPGHFNKGFTGIHSSMQEPTAAHDAEAGVFARELSKMLHEALLRHDYDTLILVAPPRFLGMVRARLDTHVSAKVEGSLARELTHANPEVIKQELHDLLSHAPQITT